VKVKVIRPNGSHVEFGAFGIFIPAPIIRLFLVMNPCLPALPWHYECPLLLAALLQLP
jgi:hypothetical protein